MSAIASAATLGRFYIRWRYAKLDWDDLFNSLALICLIGFTATPNLLDFDSNDSAYWKMVLATYMTLWTLLWCVKASVLALCWMIFNISSTFRKLWWAVTVFTFVSYWPNLLLNLWQCGDPAEYANAAVCNAYYNFPLFLASNITYTVLHIVSELLILALPSIFIRNLQMSRAQKISAIGYFGVIFITILIGLLRCVPNVVY